MITGSDKALMPALSGLARSGATRSAYITGYQPWVGLIQDGVRYDISRYVKHGSTHISQHLNADIDTATLTLLPQFSSSSVPLPKARAQIEIAMGTPSNLEFAGEIMTVQEQRVPMMAGTERDYRPFIDLTCTDWLDVFDAALVTDKWPPQSATTTILDLIARYTRGGPLNVPFGTAFVEAGMASLPSIEAYNERPSTVMQRITNLIPGGRAGFYLDNQRQVHAWSNFDGSGTYPDTLNELNETLKSFRRVTDGAQQRTRVFVEGVRTETLMPLPAVPFTLPYKSTGYFDVPIADGSWLPTTFPFPPGIGHNTAGWPQYLVRIGAQLIAYTEVSVFPRPASGNLPSVTLAQAFTAQPSGTYPLYTSAFPADWPLYSAGSTSNGWMGYVKMGEQMFPVMRDPTPGVNALTVGLYSTFRPQYALPVGTEITPLPAALFRCYVLARMAEGIVGTTPSDVKYAGFGRYYADLKPEPVGVPVVLLDVAQSASATAGAIANLEGGDGWHEHIVQDGRFRQATAEQRALAELKDFETPTVAYEWDTTDFNAKPGRGQDIAMTDGPVEILDFATITDVEITWPAESAPPVRSCRAAKTRAIQVLDAWLTDTK